ncbi:MAG: ABC-F family ATP-binding cassette domain-containing protein [Ruminiclostridium sp.]|nr:ABC-F family ATP-binding cassette domain-containing protein [Ruminiclostridium sp.]
MLLTAEHISLNFGLKQLLDDVTLYLNEGDKIGIIGINGTGKSSFLRILAGEQVPDEGKVTLDPNVQVSFLSQTPKMAEEATVLEQVFLDFSPDVRALMEYEAKTMLTRLGITDFDKKVGSLSGGQRKRVALAAVLLHPADILILDEPTNHLDSDMVLWLEGHLQKFTGGLIMVTHDRYFLERVSNRITELSRCQIRHYEANYSRYLELKTQQEEMEQAAQRKRESILRVEYQWIMRGAQARRTKNKDRIARYEELKAQTGPETGGSVQMATLSSRLGRKTVELKDVSKAFGEKVVLDRFSYGVARDDRVGVVGRNGAGKSTLLDIIAGKCSPDSGMVDRGETVRIGYFSQEGRELDPDQRVYDFIHEIAGEVKTREGKFSATQMMERFLFPTQLQGQPIGKLSGGERRRLYLLSVLMEAPNILLLDEPTNDLDVTTLAILEEYLESFPGAVIAVSHDRYFLDKMADQIFEVGERGIIRRFVGNYSEYLEKRTQEERAAEKAEKREKTARQERPARQKKLKFTFKEQHEFDTIEGDIGALEEALARLEEEMSAVGSDFIKLQEMSDQQTRLSAQLEEKMDRWVYLTDLAEKIAAQE